MTARSQNAVFPSFPQRMGLTKHKCLWPTKARQSPASRCQFETCPSEKEWVVSSFLQGERPGLSDSKSTSCMFLIQSHRIFLKICSDRSTISQLFALTSRARQGWLFPLRDWAVMNHICSLDCWLVFTPWLCYFVQKSTVKSQVMPQSSCESCVDSGAQEGAGCTQGWEPLFYLTDDGFGLPLPSSSRSASVWPSDPQRLDHFEGARSVQDTEGI